MTFQHLTLNPEHIDPAALTEAVNVVARGGVAAYPTDTSYAIGCAFDNRRAIERIYRARQFHRKRMLAILCPDLSTAAVYGYFSQRAFRLVRRLLPGPYTVIVPATRDAPRALTDKRSPQIGIRIPRHPVALELVRNLGRPMFTTTAQATDQDRPCATADDVADTFEHDVDLVIDGGPTPGLLSTVLDVSEDSIEVIREGAGPVENVLATS
jgi:tRNA threonylcarbamoyl adenosine modification protein (Sua5/YciO/YrdC/YwlC family)